MTNEQYQDLALLGASVVSKYKSLDYELLITAGLKRLILLQQGALIAKT